MPPTPPPSSDEIMPPIAPRLSILTSHIKPPRPNLPKSRASSRGRMANNLTEGTKREVMEYEYIVIGGGSGGSGTARRAASWYGKKVLLVENGRSGEFMHFYRYFEDNRRTILTTIRRMLCQCWMYPQEDNLELCFDGRSTSRFRPLRL